MPTRRQALSLAITAGVFAPAVARSQAWRPNHPLRLFVPFAPGGSNDIVARVLAEGAGQVLGQQVAIENRAGAGSVTGSEYVARSAPDGHTLLINSAHSTAPAVVARLPFDPVHSFSGVAVAGFSPHVLVVNPRLPAQTARELVALMKAEPGKYNLATSGSGSGVHLASELLRRIASVDVDLVHYRGGGPAAVALVRGEAHVGTLTMASALRQILAGELRALAVLSDQRSQALPNVPSAPEAGLAGVVLEEFFPILAPARTPAPILNTLGSAFREAIRQGSGRLQEMAGVVPRAGYESSDQVMSLVQSSIERNSSIVREAGIQLS